jgi:hypothetical protein
MNEKIRRLIDAVKEDRPMDVKKEFAALTNSRVAQLIESKKRQIAKKLFAAK